MKKVIIDTNALMAMVEWKIDLLIELQRTCPFQFQACIVEGTVRELQTIIQHQRGKYKSAAKIALAWLKLKNIPVINEEGKVDDILVTYSRQGMLVLTQDRELKKRLAKPYLTIRQKKRIMMIE